MNTKKMDSKIADATKKAEGLVTAAGDAAKKGGHRIQETAEKAGHVVEEIAVKVAHAAQGTAQKVADGAKEAASKVRQRGQELRDGTGGKATGPAGSGTPQ